MKRTLAFAAVTLVAATAGAFSVSRTDSDHLIKWYLNSNSVDIYIDPSGPTHLAAGYTYSDIQGAFQRSITSWNNIACSAMTLNIAGTASTKTNAVSDTSGTGGPAVDDKNIAVWISKASEYPFPAKVLGVTSPVFYQDGTIIEADVVFNDVADTWAVYASAADVSTYVDVESVIVHEFGHLQGLGHVLQPNAAQQADPPTMLPVVDQHLGTRSLAEDDMNGVCFLYPQDGNKTHNCSADANCPAFIASGGDGSSSGESIVDASTCSSGECTKITDVQCGSGNPGDRCCSNNCKNAAPCVLLAAQSDMAYCSPTCNNGSCDTGFTCEALASGSTKVCITNVVIGCACDATRSCDSNCSCDPDCSSSSSSNNKGGCSAIGASLWSIAGLLGVLWLRRRTR